MCKYKSGTANVYKMVAFIKAEFASVCITTHKTNSKYYRNDSSCLSLYVHVCSKTFEFDVKSIFIMDEIISVNISEGENT